MSDAAAAPAEAGTEAEPEVIAGETEEQENETSVNFSDVFKEGLGTAGANMGDALNKELAQMKEEYSAQMREMAERLAGLEGTVAGLGEQLLEMQARDSDLHQGVEWALEKNEGLKDRLMNSINSPRGENSNEFAPPARTEGSPGESGVSMTNHFYNMRRRSAAAPTEEVATEESASAADVPKPAAP